MKKEIYLKGKEQKVQLGEVITIGGAKLELTQFVIDNNEELFRVVEEVVPDYVQSIRTKFEAYEAGMIYPVIDKSTYPEALNIVVDSVEYRGIIQWTDEYSNHGHSTFKPSTKEAYDRQELMKKAKKDYPKGTKIKCVRDGAESIVKTEFNHFTSSIGAGIYHIMPNDDMYQYVVFNGEWAEIIKPKFTTYDGVDVFEGDMIWCVDPENNYSVDNDVCYIGDDSDLKYFSTEEAAQKYIDENKPKPANFTIAINDTFCTWEYDLDVSEDYSINDIAEIIFSTFKAKPSMGKLPK